MATNPAADSAELQDTAATRLLPVWIAAVQAARAQGQAATPSTTAAPAAVTEGLKLAAIAALIASWVALRRRSREAQVPQPVQPAITDVPSPGVTPSAVPGISSTRLTDAETRAEKIVPELVKHVWTSSVTHVKNNPPETDDRFVKQASRVQALELMSRAQLDLAEELGMKYKVWISRGDNKVRLLHRQLHGEPVEIDEPFHTWPTGQRLSFPGDPRAPLDATINCRCLMFVVPTVSGAKEALAPANVTEAFGIAASLEEKWFEDGRSEQ